MYNFYRKVSEKVQKQVSSKSFVNYDFKLVPGFLSNFEM